MPERGTRCSPGNAAQSPWERRLWEQGKILGVFCLSFVSNSDTAPSNACPTLSMKKFLLMSEPLLVQLDAISFCPVPCSLGEEARRTPLAGCKGSWPKCAPVINYTSGIIKWFGLEGTFKHHPVPNACHMQGHLPLDQAAQSHIQPGLGDLQGLGVHKWDSVKQMENGNSRVL
ncbi:hypothetical protein DUI87_15600 [Hirundo rustica rustica]|uniref:Uncharacterized protein n=1 Tax=Hirundo rustica rustica TaxID=333673 RepID=A0A3M0K521_HIRRU|nr:hypothetical protein DUI87_15600 [Hirundo rustica rustica]